MIVRLAETAILSLAMAGLTLFAKAENSVPSVSKNTAGMSVPKDANRYSRVADPEDFDPLKTRAKAEAANKALAGKVALSIFVADTVVNNTDSNLKNTDTFGDGEISIAVDPDEGERIVITAFSGSWGATAPLWLSKDKGVTWTKEFTINPPLGASGVPGCPCDQAVDFDHFKALAGTFLTDNGAPQNVYSALSSNLRSPTGAFHYFNVAGVSQRTNHLDGLDKEDQPWLLVGRTPGSHKNFKENVYVAYDDFNTAPDMRVAVAAATDPLNFTIDNRTGFSGPGFINPANPGHRLAVDPRSGAVYSLFQRPKMAGAGGSQNIDYMLNRSIDGGKTWGLNGSPTGIVVANADSTQAQPKFCTVNALLGGADHAAVDPQTGDVLYVYGNRDPITGNNRLAMRRLTDDKMGGLAIGPEIFVTGQVQAAIPSVAVSSNHTIGLFYYTCDGISTSGFPILTAHFGISPDRGTIFADITLETFLSPAKDDGDPRQRVLGDYMQVKALGDEFFGGFTGNGVPFGRSISNNDPIFYKVSVKGK